AATSPPGSPVAAASAPDASGPPAQVGHLEHPDRLEHLFESLAGLEQGRSHDDVRVLQYGDSHTASDLGVGVFRRAMQARFGEGGRGFIPIGRPWKFYGEDGVRGGMTKEFEPVRVRYVHGAFEGVDGSFGLLGVGVAASRAGARAWADVTVRTSRVEVAYLQQPSGGSFELAIDGAPAGRVATRGPQPGAGYFA